MRSINQESIKALKEQLDTLESHKIQYINLKMEARIKENESRISMTKHLLFLCEHFESIYSYILKK